MSDPMHLSPYQAWRGLTRLPATAREAGRRVSQALSSSSRGSPLVTSGRVMGTYYVITVGRRPRRANPEALLAAARERLCRVEALMSTYLTESDVGRFNAAGDCDWISVSQETVACVSLACQIGMASGGLFDVTAGLLVRLWGFGPGGGWKGVPEDAAVAEAKSRVGLDRLEIRPDPPALRKRVPGVEIDLASVAKGYAVDLACETLDQMGVSDYCIEVGGEVRTKGLNARGLPWQIAIESPAAEGGFHCMVPLSGQAMATSGDYRIYGEQDGARFPHIIDPRTGRPVRHDLASVSVIDPSCARADAWATVLMVAGLDARTIALNQELAALFISRTDQGFIETQTPNFPATLE